MKTRSKSSRGSAPRADIERVDREGFQGWVVTAWKDGIERRRPFAQEDYASPSAAFAAAIRFRNRVFSEDPKDPSKPGTGIPGISIGKVRTTSGRVVKHYKVSVYGADGKRRYSVFSWLKHGKERALELAKNALSENRKEPRRGRDSRQQKRSSSAAAETAGRGAAPSRSKPTGYKNVRRLDHNFFHGFAVTLRREYSRHAKYFSDGDGGRTAALARALEYRDALLAELPPPVRIHRRTKSATGIPGVALVRDRKRSGRIVERFVAYWHRADGRREKRSFSTLEHGFARAKAKAIATRKLKVAELIHDRKEMLLEELEVRKRRRTEWRARCPDEPPPF